MIIALINGYNQCVGIVGVVTGFSGCNYFIRLVDAITWYGQRVVDIYFPSK